MVSVVNTDLSILNIIRHEVWKIVNFFLIYIQIIRIKIGQNIRLKELFFSVFKVCRSSATKEEFEFCEYWAIEAIDDRIKYSLQLSKCNLKLNNPFALRRIYGPWGVNRRDKVIYCEKEPADDQNAGI